MIIDFATEVATAQVLTAADAFTLSTNVIDLQRKVDIATGERLFMQFVVTTAFVAGVLAPTLQFGPVMADSANFVTNAIWDARVGGPFIAADFSSPRYVASGLPLGAIFNIPLAPISRFTTGDGTFAAGVAGYMKRFLAAAWTQPLFATASFSAGAMSARLLINPAQEHELQNIYVSGYTVA